MAYARKGLLIMFILMAGVAALANTTRGVYVNGKVHYFTLPNDDETSRVQHQAGVPNPPSSWLWSAQETQSTPLNAGYTYMYTWGEGTAVLNNKIYYFPIGVPGGNTNNGRKVYCAAFDLPSNAFETNVITLGSVNAGYIGVGSAAVTFSPPEQNQSTIYVFTDNNIFTSGDGVNWSAHGPLVSTSNMVEPLDAIVFYPPDSDPMIMVVYMKQESYYQDFGLYAAIWNGHFGTAPTWTQLTADYRYDAGALFLGTAGASSPYHAGAKQTCVQLFADSSEGFQRWEYAYGASGGTWTKDSSAWSPSDYNYSVRAFPWYEVECSQNCTEPSCNEIQRQHFVLNWDKTKRSEGERSGWTEMAVTSDALVPINNTDLPVNCSAWGGSTTATNASDGDTSEDAQTYRKYWTLVGVILGSPPFALNGWEGFELEDFSNVTYGSSTSGEVSHEEERENQLMFSAGAAVMGGIAHLFEVEDELDLGYKYGWQASHETTTTSTKGFDQTFGTSLSNTQDTDEMGKYGWAIFNVPTMMVQDYAVYAYDFNVNGPHPTDPSDPNDPDKNGTYINQDLHSTQILTDNMMVVPKAFELANPGGPNDTVPGLMAGMGTFSKSTDLGWWAACPWAWESKTSPWSLFLGDGTLGEGSIDPLTYVNGAGKSVFFSQEQEDLQTAGSTSDIDISNKTQISVGTKLKGFKASLSAGYECHFASSVTNSTSWEKTITADLEMKPGSASDDIKSLTVQPYILKASNSSNSQLAPWIPTNYNAQQPWCMTWKVTGYSTYGGTQAGMSAPPDSGSGTVVGGSGGRGEGAEEASSSKGSSYSIKGGRMTWVGANGNTLVPAVTADDFDPNSGASVHLNGYSISAVPSLGKWSRNGEIWKYKTKESAKHDVVVLKLDFGSHTWDLDLSKAELSSCIPPSRADLRINLIVNGKYKFHAVVEPQIKTSWDLKVAATPAEDVEVTRYLGEYDSAKGEGSITLKGNLPGNLEEFGDMSFNVNGHQFNASLISLKDYDKSVSKGKELVYDNGGLHLVVNFGKGTWKAEFKKEAFHPLLAPLWGHSKIRVLVGGMTVYSMEHAITDHTTKPSFRG